MKHPPPPPIAPQRRVIVFLQENKTTDFYFASLADWGADVHRGARLLSAPPDHDQPHDRSAWVHYRGGDYPASTAQVDTDAVIPYYAWLAKTFTFCDHHFGLGTNSTPGHMLAVGGQAPTLKNPPFSGTGPVWDLPSILGHAQRHGIDWAAFPASGGYPLKFYQELTTAEAAPHLHADPADFIRLARAGALPPLVYAWAPPGADEHPPQKSDPQYVARGQQSVWDRVEAVIAGGGWAETVFILTWDDWGGYADHVVTPSIETVVDALHPQGFTILGGSRIPLLVFGGGVLQGIDNRWHSHASIPKTVIDLLGLPPLGVPRVDEAPSLATHAGAAVLRPRPPSPGSAVVQPTAPLPRPLPVPPPPWAGPLNRPLAPLVTTRGGTLPAPDDAVVHPKPPAPPATP